MKTYKNLYPKLCSYNNLIRAFHNARKNKSKKEYVKEFEKNLDKNLLSLKKELENQTYRPSKLTKFIIQDPKTRVIRKSVFKDRIVHHAIINIIEPIFEKRFIYDSYANRTNKGTIAALKRFDKFKRKVSKNGRLIKHPYNNNSIQGYVLKADIRHFFDSINQEILLRVFERKIKDKKLLNLIDLVLKNFETDKIKNLVKTNKITIEKQLKINQFITSPKIPKKVLIPPNISNKGMPLGNMTSQFFANLYLNQLDQFIKHRLKMKYYIRYVDDFVILHESKEELEKCKDKISKYLMNLGLELHPDKSKIFSIYKGVDFLGFKSFYHYKLVRKRNLNQFKKKLAEIKLKYEKGEINQEKIYESLQGWFAYIFWGNTFGLRKNLLNEIKANFPEGKLSDINYLNKLAHLDLNPNI